MSQTDAAAAAGAAAALLMDAFSEPGFATVCVKKAAEDAPDARALFIEMPLAATEMTAKLMAQTADRPPDQRFRPFVTRIRALKADEIAKVRAVIVRVARCAPCVRQRVHRSPDVRCGTRKHRR